MVRVRLLDQHCFRIAYAGRDTGTYDLRLLYGSLSSLSFQRPFALILSLSHNHSPSELFHKASGISRILGMDSPWNQGHWEAFMLQPGFYIHPNNQPPQPEPQWQSHGMPPPAGKQNEARKYTVKDWDAQRLEIARLYEENTLESVREFMRKQHGLDAT